MFLVQKISSIVFKVYLSLCLKFGKILVQDINLTIHQLIMCNSFILTWVNSFLFTVAEFYIAEQIERLNLY